MTVDQMTMISHVFLGMMIFFLITAMIVFVALDVTRAWRILTGRKVPVTKKKKEIQTESIITQSADVTELLNNIKSINNQDEGYEATTVLEDTEEETAVLISHNDKEENIVMDITFIHTEVTL